MSANDLEVQDIYLYADADGDGGHLIVADSLDESKASHVFENQALGNQGPLKQTGAYKEVGPGEL